jgi:methionine-S-sulfoxide reductase
MNRTTILSALLSLMFSSYLQAAEPPYEKAILAGGCFWCVEADYEKLEGVVDAVSGYTGGELADPTYKQVSSGTSGHLESVEVTYDPDVLNYGEILDYFWRHIDPTRDDGQFCDRGPQYRPAVFFLNGQQREIAEDSLQKLDRTKPFPDRLKVELLPAATFYPAEDYHQDYYRKNPIRYKFYRYRCGRDQRVEELWGGS